MDGLDSRPWLRRNPLFDQQLRPASLEDIAHYGNAWLVDMDVRSDRGWIYIVDRLRAVTRKLALDSFERFMPRAVGVNSYR